MSIATIGNITILTIDDMGVIFRDGTEVGGVLYAPIGVYEQAEDDVSDIVSPDTMGWTAMLFDSAAVSPFYLGLDWVCTWVLEQYSAVGAVGEEF